MRTSVRPDGTRRQTLCGLLAEPSRLHRFDPRHTGSCATCTVAAATYRLTRDIEPSNELAAVRALLDEARHARLEPSIALDWIYDNGPTAASQTDRP